jgi:hypothetical protein
LNGRVSGQRYSQEQRERIVQEVERLRAQGMPISAALKSWSPSVDFLSLEGREEAQGQDSSNSLLPSEEERSWL